MGPSCNDTMRRHIDIHQQANNKLAAAQTKKGTVKCYMLNITYRDRRQNKRLGKRQAKVTDVTEQVRRWKWISLWFEIIVGYILTLPKTNILVREKQRLQTWLNKSEDGSGLGLWYEKIDGYLIPKTLRKKTTQRETAETTDKQTKRVLEGHYMTEDSAR